MRRFVGICCSAVVALFTARALAQDALTERRFAAEGSSSGTVVLAVNWGRCWKCGPFENAQLQRLAFRRLGSTDGGHAVRDWKLEPASTLLAQSRFTPYVFLLEPGQYALSGVKLRVAASESDVRVADVDSSRLVVDGQPKGGSFVEEFGKKYPYVKDVEVKYRLLETT